MSTYSPAKKDVRPGNPGRRWYAEPALWAVLGILLVLFAALDRPLAVGDGLAYLIWLDSIALDGDLDLSNQAEKFGAVNTYHIYRNPNTGRWASAFPLGIAILLTPFYWLGALLDKLPAFRVNDAHFIGIQGVPYAYTLCAMLGVNLYALITATLGYRLVRGRIPPLSPPRQDHGGEGKESLARAHGFSLPRTVHGGEEKESLARAHGFSLPRAVHEGEEKESLARAHGFSLPRAVHGGEERGARMRGTFFFPPVNCTGGTEGGLGPWAAAAATLATFVGTPLLFYSTIDPINSHIAGAFAAALVLSLWLPARKRARAADWRAALPWLWVGLAVGLTALCRWQIALIALPVGVELLIPRRRGKPRLREAVVLVLGFCLLAWVIPYSWWQMYGKLALIPATEGDTSAMLIGPVNTLKVLFSPIAGLFPWSPLAGLALLGLLPLAKKDGPLALSLLVMVILQALVNGMVKNWWAGIGFGMRRMAELYPLYLLCLAALLRAANSLLPRVRDSWAWLGYLLPGLAWTATAALAAYGLALVIARMSFTWTNPWGLARDTPLKELRYAFSPEKRYLIWPVIKDHVGFWAWKKPGP